ncbi:response regulator receiver protein [Mycobacterium sp. 852002-50816_SCH5313054-b]|uniref:GAF and ANTAR domain-containing protein n=1 Tax=Mycobacterium sp. 852002-50816_SCH5313054-b TaxID=1834092 RepID=UPI0008005CC4|nr:GAF and ANTAR domain-containing protein [Mycobacterium sp. 852002-50816_SCH5313054-b]OBF53286.1 response regulator receiver protein [Mycobacterium sp. 852002-50816_SCH5313054-b]
MLEDANTVAAQLTALIADLDRHGTETSVGLQELVDSGTRYVAGCQYAGITLADKTKAVTNVAATHRYPMVLDAIQNRYGEGPCLSAVWQHHVMHVEDLNVDQRWPNYQRQALEQTPIRSILSYELFADSRNMAALNFYAEYPHAFTGESLELGGVFATHVALAWSVMRRQDQFRSALASRDIIGQAKGVIMERFKLDAVEAFELLSRLSQNSNTKVIEIARSLIDTEHPLNRRERIGRGA